MSIAPELIQVKAEVADVLREVFENEGARLFLLKRASHSKDFTVVGEITSGWRARFSEYRGQMQIRIATIANSFEDLVGQASHFGYGVPDGDDEIEVFAIDPDGRDVVRPNGNSQFWKIFGSKTSDDWFAVPEE